MWEVEFSTVELAELLTLRILWLEDRWSLQSRDLKEKSTTTLFCRTLVLACFSLKVSAENLPPFVARKSLTAPVWDARPFWKKDDVQKAMASEERKLAVSVTVHHETERLLLKGAGLVRRTPERTYQVATRFSELKSWSPYFNQVAYNPELEQVALHVSVLGFSARSLVQFAKTRCGGSLCLLWEVLAGSFKGLKGAIRFAPDARQTEISMMAEFKSSQLPLPAGLTALGLEAVLQRVASSIRSHIESVP